MNIGEPVEIVEADPAPEPIPPPQEIEEDADHLPEHERDTPVEAPAEETGVPV